MDRFILMLETTHNLLYSWVGSASSWAAVQREQDQPYGGRRKGRRTEEQRREVCPHLRRPQAKVPLAHYASFPEDWTILVLVLKVCDSKALVFPKCKTLKSGNI